MITTLTQRPRPLIRYRTRDLSRLLPGTARSMRRMQKITGRSDDMIILRGVNVFPTQIEEQLMKVPTLAPHFQIELSRSGRLDQLTVHVEQVGATDAQASAAAAADLTKRIKDVVGVSARVKVGDSGAVARSEGKAVRVLDNRPKE